MNLFQLVLKQMRQRALSTWLTLLSVMLGVALAIAILVLQRESEAMFAQSDFGYDVVIGAKGSPLQLVLNSVYHIDQSPGSIPYSLYTNWFGPEGELARYASVAVPIAVGDNYEGYRIVGTPPQMFGFDDEGQPLEGYDARGHRLPGYQNPKLDSPQRDPDRPTAAPVLEYRQGRKFTLAEGRMYHGQKFEAVIGQEVARATGLTLGSTFKATHGLTSGDTLADEHDQEWTVVGILDRTHTANDKLLFIPLPTFYAIDEHGEGLEAIAAVRGESAATPHAHSNYTLDEEGRIKLDIPQHKWRINAIFVDTRGQTGFFAQQIFFIINNRDEATAVNPAMVMREFFQTFLAPSASALLMISVLVSIVAGVSILVSIYNSITARAREIAIIRALGATRRTILGIICLEATLVGLVGGVVGLLGGHLVAAGGSVYLRRIVGEGIHWYQFGIMELLLLGGVVVIAFLAGLVPALKAYGTPVADNLVAA